ncbi:MAG: glycosyltransferase [Clostridiales bacterium]|nr:glycosyltransferase [Clostridiales bacterium]
MTPITQEKSEETMGTAPLITVIVPVYNGKEYLDRCVDSVLSQQIKEIELILLDDGSTDGSVEKLRELEAAHPELIKVFTHPNKGVANTRNEGIERATGKYILFLDQDDYFDPDYMKTFFDAAEAAQADVVIGGYRRPDKDGRIRFTVRPTNEEYIRYKNLQAWAKIHRTAFLQGNHIRLFQNPIGEDIPFTLRENALAANVVMIDYVGYNWYYNESSVSLTIQTGLDRNIDGILNLLNEIHKTRTDKPLFAYIVVKTVVYLLLACGRVDAPETFLKYYRLLFNWLSENYPGFQRNRYIAFGPRGQERRISVQVCAFLWMHRLRFVGAFAHFFCKG